MLCSCIIFGQHINEYFFIIYRQFFYDAVPMVATEASLALTAKLVAEKIVQGVEADAWLTQLAFIPRPNYEMLAAIMVNLMSY